MLALKWTPLIAGTVISVQAWESIPEKFRPEMLAAAERAGERLRGKIRKMDEDSIRQMKMRGLTVIELDEETRKAWQAEALKAYPSLRGRYAPSDLFDQAVRLSRSSVNQKRNPGHQVIDQSSRRLSRGQGMSTNLLSVSSNETH